MEDKKPSKYPKGYDNSIKETKSEEGFAKENKEPTAKEVRTVDSYPGSSGQTTR